MLSSWCHSSTAGPLHAGVNSCNVMLEKQLPSTSRASALKKTLPDKIYFVIQIALFQEQGNDKGSFHVNTFLQSCYLSILGENTVHQSLPVLRSYQCPCFTIRRLCKTQGCFLLGVFSKIWKVHAAHSIIRS